MKLHAGNTQYITVLQYYAAFELYQHMGVWIRPGRTNKADVLSLHYTGFQGNQKASEWLF